MEFLVTMCEARDKAPGMMRKLPQFADKLYEALMLFLLDIEDEVLWHTAEDETHEEEGAGELCDFGQVRARTGRPAACVRVCVRAACCLLPPLVLPDGSAPPPSLGPSDLGAAPALAASACTARLPPCT
jgi:hypothetical protein